MGFFLQLTCGNNLCWERERSFYVVDAPVRAGYRVPMFLKILEKTCRFCLADDGYGYIICLDTIKSLPVWLIKVCISECFIVSINVKVVICTFVFLWWQNIIYVILIYNHLKLCRYWIASWALSNFFVSFGPIT